MKPGDFTYEGNIYFPDAKLLKCARGVFGSGVVKQAWVGSYDFKNDLTLDRIANARDQIKRSSTVNEIDNGCLTIAIEFFAGNIVVFTNSEWGSMTKVNQTKLHKENA